MRKRRCTIVSDIYRWLQLASFSAAMEDSIEAFFRGQTLASSPRAAEAPVEDLQSEVPQGFHP